MAVVGKGLQWAMTFFERRAESRAAKLQAWHDELAAREATIDAKLEERLVSLEGRAEQAGEQALALRMAFEIVAGALRTIDPHNTALSRAEQLLSKAFPLAPIVPPDMAQMVQRIEQQGLAATAAARRTEG